MRRPVDREPESVWQFLAAFVVMFMVLAALWTLVAVFAPMVAQ